MFIPVIQRDIQPIPYILLDMMCRAYQPDSLAVSKLGSKGKLFVELRVVLGVGNALPFTIRSLYFDAVFWEVKRLQVR